MSILEDNEAKRREVDAVVIPVIEEDMASIHGELGYEDEDTLVNEDESATEDYPGLEDMRIWS